MRWVDPLWLALAAGVWLAEADGPGERLTLYGALIVGLLAVLTRRVVPGWVYVDAKRQIDRLERVNDELAVANEQLRQLVRDAVVTTEAAVSRPHPSPTAPPGPPRSPGPEA